MIRPSPELLAICQRWYQAVVDREMKVLQNIMSDSDYQRFVGTAEDEIWSGPTVRAALGDHLNEMPRMLRREELLSEAFEAESVGWVFYSNNFWFEGREDPVNLRTTMIFTLEDGSWKVIHRHTSVGTPNQTLLGYDHSAIQALLDVARQDPSLARPDGLAAVMFTDIADSAVLNQTIGDAAWSKLVAHHLDEVGSLISDADGTLVKTMGDGSMSTFATPRAALNAAQTIQRTATASQAKPGLRIRIGIHTGEVVENEGDFFGTVVNKAARITAQAEPGEIRVSDATRVMVGETAEYRFADPVRTPLKGLSGDHLIHALEWQE